MAVSNKPNADAGQSSGNPGAKIKAGGGEPNGKKDVNVFHQRLASLTYHQASQMIGAADGARRMRPGNRFTEIDLDRGVYLGGDLLRVRMTNCDAKYDGEEDPPERSVRTGSEPTIVTMTMQSKRAKQITINCNQCDDLCHHMGAALEYLLDTKSVPGLAAPAG